MLKSTDHFSLLDLIDLDDLQDLQDMLAEVNGLKSVIIDPDGHPLTMPSNEIPLCRMVHHTCGGAAQCADTIKTLSAQIKQNPRPQQLTCLPCAPFGIVKAAVPISVQGVHLANWWIARYRFDHTSAQAISTHAHSLGLDAQALARELAELPRHDGAHFDKVIAWIGQLSDRIARLGYQNRVLTRDISKLHQVEGELQAYKHSLETLVQDRTAALIRTNSRMQLEVLERDLIEAQIARKTKLLDAINQLLLQTLTDRSDQELAVTFLQLARQVTESPFGFAVEYNDLMGQVLAADGRDHNSAFVGRTHSEPFVIKGVWQQLIQTGKPVVLRHQLIEGLLPDGYPGLQALLAVPLRNQVRVCGFVALANNPQGYLPADQDDIQALAHAFVGVLQRNRTERAKNVSEKRLKLALDSANEGLWDYFPQTRIIYFSPRWYAMLGYGAEEFPNAMQTWTALTHPDDLATLIHSFDHLIGGRDQTFRIEIRMLSRSGQWLWFQVRGSIAEKDRQGVVQRMVGTLIDISKYKQVELSLQKANVELQRLAALDELTQIANRRRFDEGLTQEWRRARRDGSWLALILCDIDFFKLYNDTYGHLKGDDALNAVAQTIHTLLKRPMDLVARYGGEEFAVVLPNTDIRGAVRVARKIQAAIEALAIEHAASTAGAHISLSFGVAATVPQGEMPPKALIERSDQALYRAKAEGRNRIVFDGANEPLEKR